MMKKGILVVDFLENVNFELIPPSPSAAKSIVLSIITMIKEYGQTKHHL